MKVATLKEQLDRIESLLAANQPRPLTLPEAAAYLNLGKSRLYKLTSTNVIPHYKPGGKKIFFLKSDLDAYLLRNRVASADEVRERVSRGSRVSTMGPPQLSG
jgi:excisionase family DNA binding protein